jgi:nitric oxide reductase NorE protein
MTRHDRHPLEDLPGDLMIWVLILSELLVFGAGLAAFLAVRMRDPAGFAAAEALLHRSGAALGTLALVTSGWLAALATAATAAGGLRRARWQLLAAAALGLVFLGVKASEYSALAGMGIGTDTSAFFTFFYLLTGFHAAHVVAGVGL